MLIGGLWHGANLRFVIWGGLHGIALIFDKLIQSLTNIFEKKTFFRFISTLVTFHFVCFCWIFFRANNSDTAFILISKIFSHYDLELIPTIINSYWKPLSIIVIGYAIHWLNDKAKTGIRETFIKTPIVLQLLAAVLTAILLYQFKTADIQAFIYFQF
jgi:hypothetical protein